MKKLILILASSLFFLFLGIKSLLSKDLSGNQLMCDGFIKNTAIGIDFISESKGIYYEIKNDPKWYVEKDEFTYKVTPDYINMTGKINLYIPQLSRETLKLNRSRQCQILDLKSKDMDKLMNFTLETLKKESEAKNKL